MKVLHLIPDLGLGGAQRLLCYLLTAMDRERYRPYVAYWGEESDLHKDLEDIGVEVTRLKEVNGSLFRLAVALASHLRRTKPDLVHTHLFDADLVGTLVAYALGVPCCSTIHSSTFFAARRHQWRYRGLALLIGRFFPVSQALGNVLIEECGVPISRVQVIYNGI